MGNNNGRRSRVWLTSLAHSQGIGMLEQLELKLDMVNSNITDASNAGDCEGAEVNEAQLPVLYF